MKFISSLSAAVLLLSLAGCAFAPPGESIQQHPAAPHGDTAAVPQPRSLQIADKHTQHDHSQHDHSQHDHSQHDHSQHRHGGGR